MAWNGSYNNFRMTKGIVLSVYVRGSCLLLLYGIVIVGAVDVVR